MVAHLIDEKNGSDLPDSAFADPTIFVCEELTPTFAERFRRLSIAGVIQLGGGATSHGAILARALGLPAIGGYQEGTWNAFAPLRRSQSTVLSVLSGLILRRTC